MAAGCPKRPREVSKLKKKSSNALAGHLNDAALLEVLRASRSWLRAAGFVQAADYIWSAEFANSYWQVSSHSGSTFRQNISRRTCSNPERGRPGRREPRTCIRTTALQHSQSSAGAHSFLEKLSTAGSCRPLPRLAHSRFDSREGKSKRNGYKQARLGGGVVENNVERVGPRLYHRRKSYSFL